MVYLLLGNGFEETEAITPWDLLLRAGVEVKSVGIGGKTIVGGHGIRVEADITLNELRQEDLEMIVLPGGLGGVESIGNSEKAMEAVKTAYENGKYVAAICAAPTLLARLGITDGKKATCYPGMENEMGSAVMTGLAAVQDGTVICGRAAGAAMEFGFLLVAALKGEKTALQLKQGWVYEA